MRHIMSGCPGIRHAHHAVCEHTLSLQTVRNAAAHVQQHNHRLLHTCLELQAGRCGADRQCEHGVPHKHLCVYRFAACNAHTPLCRHVGFRMTSCVQEVTHAAVVAGPLTAQGVLYWATSSHVSKTHLVLAPLTYLRHHSHLSASSCVTPGQM